jgi:L-ascorbate metabolism protein UlaG (beta-lactamase superfamily)
MLGNRRQFLKLAGGMAAVVGGASWWVAVSRQRAANWTRRLLSEARRPILPATAKPTLGAWSDNDITVCWIGHSTVLISFYGLRILTDPVFGSRVGIRVGVGTIGLKRYIQPALTWNELPPIDLVLLSHAHMDHMDLPTLARFGRGTTAVTAKVTADLLSGTELQFTETGWNDRLMAHTKRGDVELRAIEVKHWGQRWPSERRRGYNGYIIRREGRSLLFAGDTAVTPLFSELHSSGPFELAIMPIGAYRPWIWNHCTPEEAVEMANAAGARYIVPVHHQTFRLSDEPMQEPIERLQSALAHEPERLALRCIGETFVCPSS